MPSKPISPPPRTPVPEYLTANPIDGYFTELISRDDSAWRELIPIRRGTKYSSIKGANQEVINQFAAQGGLYFCKAVKPGNATELIGSDQFLILVWATVFAAESPENSEIGYDAESVAHPMFRRAYTVRRDTYEASPTIALGTALTALIGVQITAGGTGYTTATATIGVAGTGGAVELVISAGVIVSAIVTKEGTGHTAATTITISGDGAGATATASVQPVSCVLTAQVKREFPDDSPLSHEFVQVLRTYMTLPGPLLEGGDQVDDDGETIFVTRQRMTTSAFALITPREVVAGGFWTEITGEVIDDFTVFAITKSRVLSTAASNIISSSDLDEERRAEVYDYWQYVPDGTVLPVIGSTYQTALILVHNVIASLTIGDPGTGYITIPTLEIAAPDGAGGTQATATVTSLAAVSATFAYIGGTPPAIGDTLIATTGTGTQATFTVSGGALETVVLSGIGSGYLIGDLITLDGGIYTEPAVVTVTELQLVGLSPLVAGTGMVPTSVLTLTGGTVTPASTIIVSTTKVVSATLAAGGTGGTNGVAVVTGTTGTGTKFTAAVTIAGNTITVLHGVLLEGSYTANPTVLTNEPVTGGGLVGAQLNVVMGVNTVAVDVSGVYTATAAIFTSSGTGDDNATFDTPLFGITQSGATTPVSSGGDYQTPVPTYFTQLSTNGAGIGAEFDTPTFIPTTLSVLTGGAYTVITDNPTPLTAVTGSGSGMTAILAFGIGAVSLTDAGTKYYSGFPTVTVSYGTAQIIANPDALAPIATPQTGYIVDHALDDTPRSLIKRMRWTMMPLPPTRKTWPEIGWEAPGDFTPLVSSFTGTVPWPGIHYRLIQPKRQLWPALQVISYKLGPFGDLPPKFLMYSPAADSRIFPGINPNTRHSSFGWQQSQTVGDVTTLIYAESFPKSTTYRRGQIVVVGSTQQPDRGSFYEKRVTYLSENGVIY